MQEKSTRSSLRLAKGRWHQKGDGRIEKGKKFTP